jgi:hypothetical protein
MALHKKAHVLPPEDLALRCKEFLDISSPSAQKLYEAAVDMIVDADATTEEAQVLPFHPLIAGHRYRKNAGIFMSALYNRNSNGLLVCDHELDIDYYGVKFQGTIVNRGSLGQMTGYLSSAMIINLGRMDYAQTANAIIISGNDPDGPIYFSDTSYDSSCIITRDTPTKARMRHVLEDILRAAQDNPEYFLRYDDPVNEIRRVIG